MLVPVASEEARGERGAPAARGCGAGVRALTLQQLGDVLVRVRVRVRVSWLGSGCCITRDNPTPTPNPNPNPNPISREDVCEQLKGLQTSNEPFADSLAFQVTER